MTKIDDIIKKTGGETKEELSQRLDEIESERQLLAEEESKREKPRRTIKFNFRRNESTQEDLKKDHDIVKKILAGQTKIKRKEKRMIENKEFEGTKLRNNMFMGFAVMGLFFIMFLYLYMKMDWMFIIVLLLGSMMFLPVGMVLGWAVLDPYVRCKILRKMTRKNYGIINFVGKGQKLISKIKNFEQALVWKKNEVWIISEEFVYQLTKDGDSIVEKGKINPESIVTLIDTVPVMFVDVDSMQPLTLARDRREGINPLELGATLKSWVDNQLAKAMFLKQTYNIYFVIIIGCSIGAILFGYVNYTKLDELSNSVKTLSAQIQSVLSQLPPPSIPK
jgi:hypothetical protein